MNKTYLFYDIETTGLSKCFDQVLQFAAIRCDERLNEIERHQIHVKLNIDTIPAPEATITHRIGLTPPSDAVNELQAITTIHRLLNQPNTISLGYNTLGFDDEFLRFAFYRNLLTPYTHQYANGCARADIYPIAILYWLYKPDIIQWPIKNDGKVSLKLEDLNQKNQWVSGQAHDAMVDVEATIALARHCYTEKPMWDYAIKYFDKTTDLHRTSQLPILFNHRFNHSNQPVREALLVQGFLGHKNQFQAPVITLGQHKHYKNQQLWLRLDDDNLQKIQPNDSPDKLAENSQVFRRRPAEQAILLPPESRFIDKLDPKRRALADQNKNWLQQNPELLTGLQQYHLTQKYPIIENIDIDAGLYELGFPSQHELQLFRDFHAADPNDKLAVVHSFINSLQREQALRVIARHYPDVLTADDKAAFIAHCTNLNETSESTPRDYRGEPKRTREAALQAIQKLRETVNLDAEQTQLLAELETFLQSALTTTE